MPVFILACIITQIQPFQVLSGLNALTKPNDANRMIFSLQSPTCLATSGAATRAFETGAAGVPIAIASGN